MKQRRKRLLLVAAAMSALAVAAVLVLRAFQQNMVFFYTPTQVSSGEVPKGRSFRIGGMVEAGSLRREADGLTVKFVVTDTARHIPVSYRGILPDLFREEKGVVAQGRLNEDGHFIAEQVLAKHDENYMPPEAAEALKRAGGAAVYGAAQ